MELTGDDMSALSEAVEAHFSDRSEMDLREEIALRRNNASRGMIVESSHTFRGGRTNSFQVAPGELERRRLIHPKIMPRMPSHPRSNISHRGASFRPHHPLSATHKIINSGGDMSPRLDERHVYRAPPPHIDSSLYERSLVRERYVEAYDELRDYTDVPPRSLPSAKDRWRSPSPPRHRLPEEDVARHRQLRESIHHSSRRERHSPPLPPQPYSRSHEIDSRRDAHSRPPRPDPNLVHAPDPRHESRIRRSPPVVSPTRRKPRSKRHLKRIPSRVISEDAESREDSFDDMLMQYKRNQIIDQQHYDEPPNRDFEQEPRDQFQPSRSERYSDADFAAVSHVHYDDHHGVQPENHPVQPMLVQPMLPERTDILQLNPVQYQQPFPPMLFSSTMDQPNQFVTNSQIEAPLRIDSFEPPQESHQAIIVNEQSADNANDNEANDMEQADNEEEDDDEELLQLRLAALSSAYSRNIDVAKETSVSDEKQDEDKTPCEDESKAHKKKSRQVKVKKKTAKKESKKSRSSTSEKETKKAKEEPDIEDKMLSLARKMRSPEKDFSDPKILTLGSVMMKKKSIQEQGQLREIRTLNDPEEGCKRFMNLIQSKNEREQKKKNNSTSKSDEVDNYEEVEMDVDNSSDVEEPKLEVYHPPLPVTAPDDFTTLVDPEEDAKSEVSVQSSSQPLPPGIDTMESDAEISLNPHQESIWEMLEQPLASQSPQAPPTPPPPSVPDPPASQLTSADQLISFIRAKTSRKESTSADTPAPPPLEAEKISPPTTLIKPVSSPKKVQPPLKPENEVKVDSPCDFEHAFQPTPANPDSYPDIATDLSFACSDDRTDFVDDVIDSDHAPIASEEVPNELSGDEKRNDKEKSPIPQREKLPSTEDENEMRAQLLSDLAIRRAKEPNQEKKMGKEESEKEPGAEESVTSTIMKQNLPSAIDRPVASSLTKQSRLAAKRRRNRVNKMRRKRAAAKNKENTQQARLTGANKIPLGSEAKKNKVKQTATPISSSASSGRKAHLTGADSVPLGSQTRVVQTTGAPNATPAEHQSNSDPKKIQNFKVIVSGDAKRMMSTRSVVANTVPMAVSQSKALPVVSKIVVQPTRPSSVIPAQRLVHPPVVINLVSSDEEDHMTFDEVFSPPVRKVEISKSHSNQNLVSVATTRSSIPKSASFSSLLPHPAVLAAEAKQRAKETTRKRKAENESEERPAKRIQANNQPRLSNDSHANEEAIRKAKMKSENAKLQLKDIEEKCKKVRHLLGQDKVQISRFQQKQLSKETEVRTLNLKIDEFNRELKKYEGHLSTTCKDLDKIKKDKDQAVSIMEKRQKLEARFHQQMGVLQKEIADSDTAISSLATQSNISQIVGAIRNFRRNSGDKKGEPVDESHQKQPKSTAPEKIPEATHQNHPKLMAPAKLPPSEPSTSRALATPCPSAGPPKQGIVAHKAPQVQNVIPATTSKAQSIKALLQREKQLLREKEKKLNMQKEKLKLRKVEIKLDLIKKKAKQSLRAKKLGKTSMEQSIHNAYQVQRRLSTSQNQSKLVKSAIKMRKEIDTSVENASKQLQKRKTRRRVSIVLPDDDTVLSSTSAAQESQQVSDDQDEEEHPVTPVTPILKRTRSTERRASTSSVTTPTSIGSNEANKLNEEGDSDTMIPYLSSEETNKLRRKLPDLLSPVSITKSINETNNYLTLTEMFPIPSCFTDFRFDASELTKHGNRPSTSNDDHHTYSHDVSKYSSPLLRFRCYRLTSFFRLHKTTKLSSPTYTNKLNCNLILCRYDLNGKCLDTKCIGQHLKGVFPTPEEIYLDLLWYCPSLLKTADGRQILSTDAKELQLKAARETVDRLCRGFGTKTTRSVEDTCRLLVGIMNKQFGSKRSMTALIAKEHPRVCLNAKEEDFDAVDNFDDSFADSTTDNVAGISGDTPLPTDPELRYFIENEKKDEIEKLHVILKNNPTNEIARIELAHAYLDQSKTVEKSKKESCVEYALHSLCLGIELNDQSETLWSFYIPVLREHYSHTAVPIDQVEILDQALMLMPLSRRIWNEILIWNWSLEKLDCYYAQLIENLMSRQELANSEDYPSILTHESSYYSSWLLQSIVERCHLLLNARGLECAKEMLQIILDRLRRILDEQETTEDQYWALCQKNIAKLWLIYIYLLEYRKLPPCVYDEDISAHMFGMVLGFGDVIVPFNQSSHALPTDETRKLFKDALYCSTDIRQSRSHNAKRRFAIYKSMVNFEVSVNNWKQVSTFCRGLVDLFSDESYTDAISPTVVDVWIMWTEAVMRSNDVLLITQTFDEAVTACPQSARLAYMSALYQLTSDSADVEAALIYLEKHISSLLDMQGAEYLSATELQQLYRRILRYDASIKQTTRLVFKSDASQTLVEKDKPYLWLIYCMLTELVQSQDEESTERILIPDLYEAALHILPLLEDRKVVWIQYLLYLRSNAFPSSGVTDGSSSSNSKITQRREQLAWFKRFTSIVRRCLATIPCIYTAKLSDDSYDDSDIEKYTDYTFHNEVSSIYLGCFSSSQTSLALGILTDAMPSNFPLLMRASSYFFESGDHFSVLSLLWRLTSPFSISKQGSCKNVKLWQMAMHALVQDGKYKKAVQLCHRALSALPRNKHLWHDAVSLILAYGDSRSLQSLNERCKTMLSSDTKSLVAPSITSL